MLEYISLIVSYTRVYAGCASSGNWLHGQPLIPLPAQAGSPLEGISVDFSAHAQRTGDATRAAAQEERGRSCCEIPAGSACPGATHMHEVMSWLSSRPSAVDR